MHLYARDPGDGRPTPSPEVYRQFIPIIAKETNAVVSITTGGSTRMTLDERLAFPLEAALEMCSPNMGSINFSIPRSPRA